jgi:hypothetical protein
MFTFTESQKYRSAVLGELHTILYVLPNLEAVLKTYPNLASAINQLRDSNTLPIDAAVNLSIAIIETLVRSITMQTHSIILRYITEPRKDGFAYFMRIGRALKKGDKSSYPMGMPVLAVVIGHALWYLDYSERQGKISSQTQKFFLVDVSGMLMGKSPEERAAARIAVACDAISRVGGRLYD